MALAWQSLLKTEPGETKFKVREVRSDPESDNKGEFNGCEVKVKTACISTPRRTPLSFVVLMQITYIG